MTETHAIANTTQQQISLGVLASLGAHNFRTGNVSETRDSLPRPALIFNARILPFTKTGNRSTRPRVMLAVVALEPDDTYTVTVSYPNRGQQVDHYHGTGIYADQLGGVMLALDYDGDSVLNPRYA